jgi:lysyl-tRNA synthetase class 2
MIERWEEAGVTAYPHKFSVSLRLPEYVAKYAGITTAGETIADTEERLAGRVMSIRSASNKLVFYDVVSEGAKVQIMANAAAFGSEETFTFAKDNIRRGDIVGVIGSPGKTKMGELSIVPKSIQVRTPAFKPLARLYRPAGSHLHLTHADSVPLLAPDAQESLWIEGCGDSLSAAIPRSHPKRGGSHHL